MKRKKVKVAVPRPAKVVFQYRVVALLILSVGVLGLLYAPLDEKKVYFSPGCDEGELCCLCGSNYVCFASDSGECPLIDPATGARCALAREEAKNACMTSPSPRP